MADDVEGCWNVTLSLLLYCTAEVGVGSRGVISGAREDCAPVTTYWFVGWNTDAVDNNGG